jgi:4-diphosphocytidyl-2-C-methyl-D-erythritol kinase
MGYQAPLVIKSFAKLNLYLQILNQRKDNFHNLSTLFARIDLADRITFRVRRDNAIKITTNSRQVPKDKTNLCYRAAALLQQEFKVSSGIEIGLSKRIPVGAGLGGGSSNAASVLLGLNKFWNLDLSKAKLAKLAAKLGSDVPFFIYQVKFALGAGRGDKIRPLPGLNRTKLWFILVYPNFKVSTPLIYRKYDAYLAKKKSFSGLTMPGYNVKILTSELLKKGAKFDLKLLFNNLEPVTQSLYPQVQQVKKAFCAMGLDRVMMSGSGPAVFAVCDSGLQAKRLKSKLSKQFKRWQIFAVSTV